MSELGFIKDVSQMDADGIPLHEVSVKIAFRLYSSDANGSTLWEEVHENVNVMNGVFNVWS